MEYELYYYCTGMGVLIIFFIILYHFIGEDKAVGAEGQEAAQGHTA